MKRRPGFTLVELLVAMALIVFMMLILSEAFSVGLDSFRRLKAIGDMNARMRTAVIALQDDLQADHFEGRRRVSDPNFWAYGPPSQGFFRIYHGGPSTGEGSDADGVLSSRAANHILHLTVKKRGNDRKDFFMAGVPVGSPLPGLGLPDARYQESATIYTSQWAEVAYFLRPNGNTAGATPLYALYRRQRVVAPNADELNRAPPPSMLATPPNLRDYLEVSYGQQGGNLYFNGPMDLTIPQRRLGMDPAANGGAIDPHPAYGGLYPNFDADINRYGAGGPDLAGADLLLPDVVSFEVLVLLANGTDFVDLHHAGVPLNNPNDPNNVARFNNLNPRFQGNVRVFDTWSAYRDDTYDYSAWDVGGRDTSIPLYLYRDLQGNEEQIRIVAVKINLRVWDVKTQQARQVSLIQDL